MASTSSTAQQEMLVKLSTDGVPKLFCPICNKALVSLAGYVKHLKKHEPPGGFCCRYCNERFCTDDDLKRHRETQHTTIACRLCKDATFTNEDDYRLHIRDVHQGVDRELYKCEKCGASYKTLEPFRRHMKTECGSIKPYKCDQCEMAFVTKYNLKQHVETHSGELKFCCSYCGRNFRMKARLVEHERTHTGEKPYKCDVCGKRFSHRESIVTHSSIHTGVRLVECRCCSSRFSCHSNLIKHRRNRPETCGLPEYDPPKNRIRKHTSRIPAILNPTSEIRVVNVNKIIKPDHLEKANALRKESPEKVKMKPTARKRTGAPAKITPRKRGPKRKVIKHVVIEFEESNDEEEMAWPAEDNVADTAEEVKAAVKNTSHTRETSNERQRPKRQQYRQSLAEDFSDDEQHTDASLPLEVVQQWSDDSGDDYVPYFEPGGVEEEEEEQEQDQDQESTGYIEESNDFSFSIPTSRIKQETESDEIDVTTDIQIEKLNDFEFTTLNSSGVTVKSEDDEAHNIFNEKDKILECLLNENDYSRIDNEPTIPVTNYHKKRKRAMKSTSQEDLGRSLYLRETEVVLVKNEGDEESYPLEDMLEVAEENSENTEKKECFVLVEDITHRFPELKTQQTVKVTRYVQPFYSNNTAIKKLMRRPGTRGKYKVKDKNAPKLKPVVRQPRMSAGELKAHMKMLKKPDRVYHCVDCIKMYYMRKPYEKHLRDDHKKSEVEIRKMFKEEDSQLKMDNVYKCPICNKIYLMHKRLVDHIPKHGADGSLIYKCPCYCPLYFATREDAQIHGQLMHRKQLWCDICQKFMTGCDALKSHRVRIHGENKDDLKVRRNLVCDKCGRKFMGRTQLTDHVRSDCGRVPIYQCQECGKCLTTAGILKTHMLLHQEHRPFECEQCGKTFKIKAQYKTHTRFAHSDEKRFKCHLCPKAYPYRESLLTHMSVHTGIKRFLCNGCGKRFTCVSNLQAHRKVHADSCGLLPLNAKATQYMGVQKGTLLLGAKPEPGLDYLESQTLVAKEVYTPEASIMHDISTRVIQPSETLSGGMPLNYTPGDILLI